MPAMSIEQIRHGTEFKCRFATQEKDRVEAFPRGLKPTATDQLPLRGKKKAIITSRKNASHIVRRFMLRTSIVAQPDGVVSQSDTCSIAVGFNPRTLNDVTPTLHRVAKRHLIVSRGFQPTDKIARTFPIHRVAKRHLNLTEQIPLIPRQLMSVQEKSQFAFKRVFGMMNILLTDVPNHGWHPRQTHGKNGESILPAKLPQARNRIVNPAGRSALDLFHNIAHRQARRDLQKHMHMIGDASDDDGFASIFVGNPSHESPYAFTYVGIDQPRDSVFRRENNVVMEAMKCAGHIPRKIIHRQGSSVASRRDEMNIAGYQALRGLKPTAKDQLPLRGIQRSRLRKTSVISRSEASILALGLNPQATNIPRTANDESQSDTCTLANGCNPRDTFRFSPSGVAKRHFIVSRGFQPTDMITRTFPIHRVAKRHLNLAEGLASVPRLCGDMTNPLYRLVA
jgi:hypothetical protein